MPLPPVPYDACDQRPTRVTSLSLVRDRRNDYSVPTASGHRAVVVKGYVDEVVIVCGSEEIARHRRSYGREELIFEPRHYLALLGERKTGAFDQAAPLVGWALPEEFLRRRRLLEARLGTPGPREYVQVLRLLEDFRLDAVRGAVQDAVRLGAIGFDAVKHLGAVLHDSDAGMRRPRSPRPPAAPPRSLAQYPHLPVARVATTAAWASANDLALLGNTIAECGRPRAVTKPTLLLDAGASQGPAPALTAPGVLDGPMDSLLREYDKVARHGAQEGLDCPRYLFRLCELELLDREPRAVERRIKAAKFPVLKSLETVEFPAIPSLNKRLVLELARSEYLDRREHVLALGNSGTGKTHLALAVGLAACQQGYRVRFTTAAALVNDLLEARDDKRLLRLQKQLAKQDLLIVDELGYVPMSKTTAELLFEIFSQRYEHASTLVTSNLPFNEWTEIFGSERLTGALLDRLTHHVHILELNGDSYRLEHSKKARPHAASPAP